MAESLSIPPLQKEQPVNKLSYQFKNEPEYIDTFGAYVQKRFIGPAIETAVNARGLPQVDKSFNFNEYVSSRGISLDSQLAQYLQRYSVNQEAVDDALKRYNRNQEAQSIIERSGFVKQMFGDPLLLAEISTGYWTLSAVKKGATSVGKKSFENSVIQGFDRTLAEKGLRSTVGATAFFEGTGNVLDASTRINFNEDIDTVLKQEALEQTFAVVLSGIVGLGSGKYLDRRIAQQAQAKKAYAIAMENATNFAAGVRSRPDKVYDMTSKDNIVNFGDPVPEMPKGSVSFMGEWFTNSIFYRAVPTPMKTWIQSVAPDITKLRFLKLANDGGVGFKFNQLGLGVGRSVHQEAGELGGKWGDVYNNIHDLWSKSTTRGGATVLDVPIQNTLEKIRKLRGKESLTFEDFGQHVVDIYIRQVPTNTLDPLEREAVEKLSSYFKEWEGLLNNVGLLGKTDSIIARTNNAEGKLDSTESIMTDILNSNKKFLETESKKITKSITKKKTTLANLNKTFETRGLTAKQTELRAKLIDEIPSLEDVYERISKSLVARYNVKTIADLNKVIDDLNLSSKQKKALTNLSKFRDDLTDRVNNLKAYLDGADDTVEPFFPRYFNRRAIVQNRDQFTQILRNWYKDNSKIWDWDENKRRFVQKELDNSDDAVQSRAEKTVREILDETDDDVNIGAYFGAGKSKHLMHRKLDVPNSLVKDFMVTDLKDILVAYNSKIAPKYAFARQFRTADGNAATIDDLVAQNTKEMQEAGMKEAAINRLNKDFIATYDRIVGRVITKPDTISSRAAEWLRTATQWTYLGGAGQAAIADFANLFMDHEFKTIAKGIASSIEEGSVKMAAKELKKAGDGFELIAGQFHLKYMESLSSNPFNNALTDKINNGFYTFNLLGPMTLAAKNMDALFRGHTIIDIAVKKNNGAKLSEWETTFLARYNITDDQAKRIATSPIQKTKNELYLPNTDAWTDQGAVEAFRSALRAGVTNRIIMGTPADKPLAMSGKTYLPMHIAESIGMKESKRVKGYAELESPLLALPFTFYTYTVGALNKVTTNYAQGLVRNQAAHFGVAMFLGYNIVKARTPSFAWNEMDMEDKALRAFDFSGVAAFYSDMFYRSLEMGMAFDLDNPTPFEPKFKQVPDAIGGISSVAGAPADYAYDNVKMLQMFARGQYGEGMEQAVMNIPLLGNMFIKNIRNDLKQVLGNFGESLE